MGLRAKLLTFRQTAQATRRIAASYEDRLPRFGTRHKGPHVTLIFHNQMVFTQFGSPLHHVLALVWYRVGYLDGARHSGHFGAGCLKRSQVDDATRNRPPD
jgi:hypothetical protein